MISYLVRLTSDSVKLVTDAIQGQLLERGAQVGYNLISSFLRSPNRIQAYADRMTQIALGDLYSQYIETGVACTARRCKHATLFA